LRYGGPYRGSSFRASLQNASGEVFSRGGTTMQCAIRTGAALFAVSALSWAIGAAPAADPAVDLNPGDKAPVFTSTDDQGKEWKSTDHIGKKPLVVFFYAADLTGG
jgi:hypothetical protein